MDKERFLKLVNPAIAMFVKKGEDYNSTVKLDDYFPFGDFSYIQMIHLKALRLVSLAQLADNPGSAPNYEGIKDTVLDLLNYTVFYLDYLDKEGTP